MNSLTQLLQPGQGYSWLYIPSAVLLGALHGLEPGHSKTMMAAFIVAIRGTIVQAVLLGATAALSHTAIVWIIAALGMYFGSRFNGAAVEPVMQLIAAVIVIVIAAWMLWRTWRNTHGSHDHDHDHGGLDAHAREHAEAMRRTLDGGPVTNTRIALFGLTGGLVPCPASITVLMVCLQLKQVVLGSVLVLCFGIGLALTLVASGVIAALGVRHATRYFGSVGGLSARAPYLSGALMLLVGGYMLALALYGLGAT